MPYLYQVIQEFKKVANELDLLAPGRQNFLALSGGADSVTLACLLIECRIPFEILHVNYGLRGKESDEDEKFVKQFGKKWKIKVHVYNAAKEMQKKSSGESVQMKARNLRYAWFNTFCKTKEVRIFTAHQMNDRVENFLLRVVRGSRGKFDIPSENSNIIRPLLNFTREQINQYLKSIGQEYREDSSNSKEIYSRNYIRLNVIPVLKKMNPSLEESVSASLKNISDLESVADAALVQFEKNCMSHKSNYELIHPSKEINNKNFDSLFRLWLSRKGFERSVIDKIIGSTRSGAAFRNEKFEIYTDREGFVFKSIENKNVNENIPVNPEEGLHSPIRLKFKIKERHEIKPEKKKNYLLLDADKINMPFYIRHCKTGDRFSPFGLKGSKKLSDFFTQEKMNAFEKSNQWLLCCGDEIIWIIGRRASSLYTVTEKTKKVLEIKFKDE